MLFNSLPFVLFFSSFLFLYFYLFPKKQILLLFLGGMVFYSFWNWRMSFLLFACIIANYHLGILLFRAKTTGFHNREKKILAFGIATNLLVLGFFKYTLFFLQVWNDSWGKSLSPIPLPEILLPVGISFYTFHNISYLMEIHRGKIEPSNQFLNFSVYDLFFPLLLCGPIERPNSLLPQIATEKKWKSDSFWDGLFLFFWGLWKKVLIADSLSPFVDKALQPDTILPDGILFWVALVFAFQVYADFSGYTDCARGLAKMMGFELMLNFKVPFLASNPSEFWKRWHISLSSWLRDYLYIPLGGNRLGLFRQALNLMILWILGGLWHGATYGYLLWGIYCGLQVVLYVLFSQGILLPVMERLQKSLPGLGKLVSLGLWIGGVGLTFLIFSHGLLLFRVENTEQFVRLLNNWRMPWVFVNEGAFSLHLLAKVFFILLPILFADSLQTLWKREEFPSAQERKFFPAFVFVFGIVFLLMGVFEKKEFFYFQF